MAGFTADVHFDVVDDVSDLKAVMGQNDAASDLTEANSITVDNGSGDRVVGANDGAILASFTADVDFDVVDSAQAIQLNCQHMVLVAWMRQQMLLLVAVL